MNKMAIYILLLLIFFWAMRGLTPEAKSKRYIFDESSYSAMLAKGERPVTIILQDAYQNGVIIKSNIHSYRIVRIFGSSETISVRVAKKYFMKTLDYIGLSLFRRDDQGRESVMPAPPGSLFVGELAYGKWVAASGAASGSKLGSGNIAKRHWVFFHPYQALKDEFFWGNFRPDESFYRGLKVHLEDGQVFFGPEREFGPKGSVTQSQLPLTWYKKRKKRVSLDDYIKALTRDPFAEVN